MKKKREDQKGQLKGKDELIQIRVNAAEKEAFANAALLDGKKLSEWVRDRLRRLSRQELEQAGQPIPFSPFQSQQRRP